jgi:hypothetical protein
LRGRSAKPSPTSTGLFLAARTATLRSRPRDHARRLSRSSSASVEPPPARRGGCQRVSARRRRATPRVRRGVAAAEKARAAGDRALAPAVRARSPQAPQSSLPRARCYPGSGAVKHELNVRTLPTTRPRSGYASSSSAASRSFRQARSVRAASRWRSPARAARQAATIAASSIVASSHSSR